MNLAKVPDAPQNIPGQTWNPNGSNLGIIGLGRIGCRIAPKAKVPFIKMNILYYDMRGISPEMEASNDEHDMLAEADCVTLAIPFVGDSLMSAEVQQD
jgi:lactate dehydrogenase-like 2-hydroxyacid dehydrogenase